MSIVAEQAARLIDSLPPDKAKVLLEHVRVLVEQADEEAWEKQFSNPAYALKLKALGDEALEEFRNGKTTPLDPGRM